MSDSEWLRGIADSGWNADEWSPEVKAMLRRVADRLDSLQAIRMTLGIALGPKQPGQKPIGAREWREIAERVYRSIAKSPDRS